jgi:hypothetical protein
MRKYLLFLFAGIICAQLASAQTKPVFNPLRLGIGFGVVKQSPESSGPMVYFEPSYTLFNKLAIGFRMETSHQEMKNISNIQGTLDYNYIIHGSSVRVFGGGGLGSSSVGASGGCSGGPSTSSTKRVTGNFGGMLRAGINAYHINLAVQYNFVPTTHVYDLDASKEVLASKDHQNNYWGFTFGISIGGGRKK